MCRSVRTAGIIALVGLLLAIMPACATDPTPTPPAEREVCPTVAEALYFGLLGTAVGTMSVASLEISALLFDANYDPLLMYSDGWRIDAAIELALMRTAMEDIIALPAPDSVSHIDAQVKRGARRVHESTSQFASAIDGNDMQALTAAGLLYADGADLILETVMVDVELHCA